MVSTITPVAPLQKIEYPESDGKPMAETDIHINVMIYLIEGLRDYFRHDLEVYVAGNMLFYYEEGNPTAAVAPDVFMVKRTNKTARRTYKLWLEGRTPSVIFEISSRSTRQEDMRHKRALYARLGVQEYFLFDPLEEYLRPSLQGFRLVERKYERFEAEGDGSLVSQEMGLILRADNVYLRLINPDTGQALLTPAEAQEQARRAQEQARRAQEQVRRAQEQARYEAQGRRAAEAESARLRAELARLRGETAEQ